MRLLLDTHALLWWITDPNMISEEARETIAEPDNEVFVSAITVWEIAIKRSLHQLDAPYDLAEVIAEGMTLISRDAQIRNYNVPLMIA